MPVNKQQENHLIAANTNGYDLWLSYTDETPSGQWAVTAPPTLAVGTFSVEEGSSTQLTARGASVSGNPLNYDWDLDNSERRDTGTGAGLLRRAARRPSKEDGQGACDGRQRIAESEANPNSTRQDYMRVKGIAESINLVSGTSILAGLRQDECQLEPGGLSLLTYYCCKA